MEDNRFQRLFIKLFKPVISLSEKFDENEKYILVGNHIGKYDPVLLSLINPNMKFILDEDSIFYRNLNRSIVNLRDSNLDNLRKGIVETVDYKVSCLFPLNSNNELENNNYLELLLRSNKLIMPFGIKGSYRINDDISLIVGNSFQASEYKTKLKDKIDSEIKKLIK